MEIDETVNHITECSKPTQKNKIRHDWVGNVIQWELCKRLTFVHTNKWYMNKSESVQENKTHEIL